MHIIVHTTKNKTKHIYIYIYIYAQYVYKSYIKKVNLH